MRTSDRILLVVVMLAGIATCAVLFAAVWDMLPVQSVMQFLFSMANQWYWQLCASAVLLVLACTCLWLMFVRIGPPKEAPLRGGVAIGQSGDVMITLQAISELCTQIAQQDNRVKLLDCAVSGSAQSLVINLKAECVGEQSIPDMVQKLQGDIVNMLRDTCAIQNAKVVVLVQRAQATIAPKPVTPVAAVVPATPAAPIEVVVTTPVMTTAPEVEESKHE